MEPTATHDHATSRHLKSAVDAWRDATAARDHAIRTAVAGGATVYRVAKTTGMSATGVKDIVRRGNTSK